MWTYEVSNTWPVAGRPGRQRHLGRRPDDPGRDRHHRLRGRVGRRHARQGLARGRRRSSSPRPPRVPRRRWTPRPRDDEPRGRRHRHQGRPHDDGGRRLPGDPRVVPGRLQHVRHARRRSTWSRASRATWRAPRARSRPRRRPAPRRSRTRCARTSWPRSTRSPSSSRRPLAPSSSGGRPGGRRTAHHHSSTGEIRSASPTTAMTPPVDAGPRRRADAGARGRPTAASTAAFRYLAVWSGILILAVLAAVADLPGHRGLAGTDQPRPRRPEVPWIPADGNLVVASSGR